MIVETKFIQSILPANYYTETRHNGIYCYAKEAHAMSLEAWEKLIHTLKVKFGKRFTDFNYNGTTTEGKVTGRLHFTIYLKP